MFSLVLIALFKMSLVVASGLSLRFKSISKKKLKGKWNILKIMRVVENRKLRLGGGASVEKNKEYWNGNFAFSKLRLKTRFTGEILQDNISGALQRRTKGLWRIFFVTSRRKSSRKYVNKYFSLISIFERMSWGRMWKQKCWWY